MKNVVKQAGGPTMLKSKYLSSLFGGLVPAAIGGTVGAATGASAGSEENKLRNALVGGVSGAALGNVGVLAALLAKFKLFKKLNVRPLAVKKPGMPVADVIAAGTGAAGGGALGGVLGSGIADTLGSKRAGVIGRKIRGKLYGEHKELALAPGEYKGKKGDKRYSLLNVKKYDAKGKQVKDKKKDDDKKAEKKSSLVKQAAALLPMIKKAGI